MLIDKQPDRTFLLPSSPLGQTIHWEINRNFCKLLGYIKQLKELDTKYVHTLPEKRNTEANVLTRRPVMKAGKSFFKLYDLRLFITGTSNICQNTSEKVVKSVMWLGNWLNCKTLFKAHVHSIIALHLPNN